MIVRVHRQPAKEAKGHGRFVRTAKPLVTKELEAEVWPGVGIKVHFPLNDVRTFNMYNGVGRGNMLDYYIEPSDLQTLMKEHRTKKEKPKENVVPASADW